MTDRRQVGRRSIVLLTLALLLVTTATAAPLGAVPLTQNDDAGTDEAPPADGGTTPADDSSGDQSPPSDGSGGDSGDGDSERSTEEWLVLIILGVAALAAVLGLAGMISNRRKSVASAQSELQQHVSQAVTDSRWVHDSGTVEVMRQSDPDLLRSTWSGVRLRMGGIEEQVSRLEAGTDNRSLAKKIGALAQSLVALRGAIDAYVSVKADPNSQPALTQDALDTVTARRSELEAAIEPVAATVR